MLGFYEQERQLFGSLVSVCWASNAERVGCCIARVPQGRMKQGRFCIAGFLPPRQTERPSFMRGPLPLQLHVARCVLSYPPSPQTNGTRSILNRPPFTKRRATRPTRHRSRRPNTGGHIRFCFAEQLFWPRGHLLVARGVVCAHNMYIDSCKRSSASQRCL